MSEGCAECDEARDYRMHLHGYEGYGAHAFVPVPSDSDEEKAGGQNLVAAEYVDGKLQCPSCASTDLHGGPTHFLCLGCGRVMDYVAALPPVEPDGERRQQRIRLVLSIINKCFKEVPAPPLRNIALEIVEALEAKP